MTQYPENSSWKIEHPCPQCGAPVVLGETDRVFRCAYCRNRLYIAPRPCFKYFLAPKRNVSDLFFLPYWRFKGIVFSCRDFRVFGRIVDSSLLALNLPPAPLSLGVRPQVIKLRYASPQTPGIFLGPRLPFRTFAETGSTEGPGQPIPDTFIGEIESLIYSPVSLRGDFLFDAVLDRPMCQAGGWSEMLPAEPVRPEEQISFLATLCPRCGWDLEGEDDSLVLFCRNCESAWKSGENSLESVEFSFAASQGPADVYLPFWVLTARVSGLELDSYADLARLANLPRAVRDGWEKQEPQFWVPAFKVHPNLFLRLARSMTVLDTAPERDPQVPRAPLFTVNLPVGEAFESLKVLIASLALPKKSVFPRLPQVSVSAGSHLLVYLPFVSRGTELIQETMRMSVQANALSWGKKI